MYVVVKDSLVDECNSLFPLPAINPGWCQCWQNTPALMSIAQVQKNAKKTKNAEEQMKNVKKRAIQGSYQGQISAAHIVLHLCVLL